MEKWMIPVPQNPETLAQLIAIMGTRGTEAQQQEVKEFFDSRNMLEIRERRMGYKVWLDVAKPAGLEGYLWIPNAATFKDSVTRTKVMPTTISIGNLPPSQGQEVVEWMIDQDQHGRLVLSDDFRIHAHGSETRENSIMKSTMELYLASKRGTAA